MRYFFDTEFIEDGRTIELLSIGIVAEDGREYYAEPEETSREDVDGWIVDNVFPGLTGPIKPRRLIAREILTFVGNDKPEFWAYYADYDWVALCQLYGRMIDLPRGWPKYCRDLKQWCWHLGDQKLPRQTNGEHNALADAHWVRDMHALLTKGQS